MLINTKAKSGLVSSNSIFCLGPQKGTFAEERQHLLTSVA